MFSKNQYLKSKFNRVSAKTLVLGGKKYVRNRNERDIEGIADFVYTPLTYAKNIRILKISPGPDSDAISCTLDEVSLKEKPIFEALSYTWNADDTLWSLSDGTEPNPILCNGAKFITTMNLYNTLLELRRMKYDKPLWVDAVSIDQGNVEEKIAQLSIMSDIYKSAHRVIIWLGPMSTVRNQALDFLLSLPPGSGMASLKLTDTQLNASRAETQPSVRSQLNSLTGSVEVASSLVRMGADQYHWNGVLRILRRSWFSRTWTLQELLLARNYVILMGGREISPSLLVDASRRVLEFFANDVLTSMAMENSNIYQKYRFLERIPALFERKISFEQGVRYTFEEYLSTIRHRGVTEFRDKIIAGQALLEEGFVSSLDLKASPADLFIAFASKLYQEIGVRALSLVSNVVSRVDDLPSWVPDLTRYLWPESLRYCGCPALDVLLPSVTEKAIINRKTLQLKACLWDIIDTTGETNWSWIPGHWQYKAVDPEDPSKVDESALLGHFFSTLNRIGPTYKHTNERTLDVFWQTLIAGRSKNSVESHRVWAHSFAQYFAVNLWQLRYSVHEANTTNINRRMGVDRPWLDKVYDDANRNLESRVETFLDVHDQYVEPPQGTATQAEGTKTSLRRTLSDVAQRHWGTEDISNLSIWAASKAEILSLVKNEDILKESRLFGTAYDQTYDGRRIFLSKNGYLGIAPQSTSEDDVICAVAGADSLYVLRPVEEQEDTFELVGEAYVHGYDSTREPIDVKTLNIV